LLAFSLLVYHYQIEIKSKETQKKEKKQIKQLNGHLLKSLLHHTNLLTGRVFVSVQLHPNDFFL
jgi:hypothetical protein